MIGVEVILQFEYWHLIMSIQLLNLWNCHWILTGPQRWSCSVGNWIPYTRCIWADIRWRGSTSRRGQDLACIGNIFWYLPTELFARGIVGIFMNERHFNILQANFVWDIESVTWKANHVNVFIGQICTNIISNTRYITDWIQYDKIPSSNGNPYKITVAARNGMFPSNADAQ